MNQKSNYTNSIQSVVQELLDRAGCNPGTTKIDIIPIPYGGNSRVFQIKSGHSCYLLKNYFFHPEDQRDRLGTEFGYLSFLWNHGIRAIPEPILKDETRLMGLYEFINGKTLHSGLINADSIEQTIHFAIDTNNLLLRQNADGLLADASEACFSVKAHLLCVEHRLQALNRVPATLTLDVDKRAQRFIKEKVLPIWERIKKRVVCEADRRGIYLEKKLSFSERCLSPSDFGFHNVIMEQGGRLKFIDFEYAGWDDPAKMICDFFCQPRIPVSSKYLEAFINSFSIYYSNIDSLRQRIYLLFPLFQIKWCTILLNEFLRSGRERRSFSAEAFSENEKKLEQLCKAEVYLQKIRFRMNN